MVQADKAEKTVNITEDKDKNKKNAGKVPSWDDTVQWASDANPKSKSGSSWIFIIIFFIVVFVIIYFIISMLGGKSDKSTSDKSTSLDGDEPVILDNMNKPEHVIAPKSTMTPRPETIASMSYTSPYNSSIPRSSQYRTSIAPVTNMRSPMTYNYDSNWSDAPSYTPSLNRHRTGVSSSYGSGSSSYGSGSVPSAVPRVTSTRFAARPSPGGTSVISPAYSRDGTQTGWWKHPRSTNG